MQDTYYVENIQIKNINTGKIYMLRFNFILRLGLTFLLFKVFIIYYHTPKHGEITFEPSTKIELQHIQLTR